MSSPEEKQFQIFYLYKTKKDILLFVRRYSDVFFSENQLNGFFNLVKLNVINVNSQFALILEFLSNY